MEGRRLVIVPHGDEVEPLARGFGVGEGERAQLALREIRVVAGAVEDQEPERRIGVAGDGAREEPLADRRPGGVGHPRQGYRFRRGDPPDLP